jgi:hypothetical protein
MPKTGAEKQADYRRKMKEQGYTARLVWAKADIAMPTVWDTQPAPPPQDGEAKRLADELMAAYEQRDTAARLAEVRTALAAAAYIMETGHYAPYAVTQALAFFKRYEISEQEAVSVVVFALPDDTQRRKVMSKLRANYREAFTAARAKSVIEQPQLQQKKAAP